MIITPHRELRYTVCTETILEIPLKGKFYRSTSIVSMCFKCFFFLSFNRLDFGGSYNANPTLVNGNGDGITNNLKLNHNPQNSKNEYFSQKVPLIGDL